MWTQRTNITYRLPSSKTPAAIVWLTLPPTRRPLDAAKGSAWPACTGSIQNPHHQKDGLCPPSEDMTFFFYIRSSKSCTCFLDNKFFLAASIFPASSSKPLLRSAFVLFPLCNLCMANFMMIPSPFLHCGLVGSYPAFCSQWHWNWEYHWKIRRWNETPLHSTPFSFYSLFLVIFHIRCIIYSIP